MSKPTVTCDDLETWRQTRLATVSSLRQLAKYVDNVSQFSSILVTFREAVFSQGATLLAGAVTVTAGVVLPFVVAGAGIRSGTNFTNIFQHVYRYFPHKQHGLAPGHLAGRGRGGPGCVSGLCGWSTHSGGRRAGGASGGGRGMCVKILNNRKVKLIIYNIIR